MTNIIDQIQQNLFNSIENISFKICEKSNPTINNTTQKRPVTLKSIKTKNNNQIDIKAKNKEVFKEKIITKMKNSQETKPKLPVIKKKYYDDDVQKKIEQIQQKFDQEKNELTKKYNKIIQNDKQRVIQSHRPKFQKISIPKKDENIFLTLEDENVKNVMQFHQGKKHQEIFYDISKNLQAKNLIQRMNLQKKQLQQNKDKYREKSFNNIQQFVEKVQQKLDYNVQKSRQNKIQSFQQKIDDKVKKQIKLQQKQEESKIFIKNLHQNYKLKKIKSIDNEIEKKIENKIDNLEQFNINISMKQLPRYQEQQEPKLPKIVQKPVTQRPKNRYQTKNINYDRIL